MSSRTHLPTLALVLPHPQLPVTRNYSPRTPRACTPSTPFAKQLIMSPRNSIDSWGSSTGNADDDSQWEWKPEQLALLVRALDAVPGHLYTPFHGPVPPSNLLDQIARRVSNAHETAEWPHSIRATRAKLVEIARASDKENMTIDETDEEQAFVTGNDAAQYLQAKRPGLKRPLYRQSSMDFLPAKDKTSGSLSRLSTRLQRADRIIPSYHPYARPSSRSPSPPNLVTAPRHTTPLTTTRVLRPRPVPGSLAGVPFPHALRRSISTLSNPGGSIKPSTRIRRADSFSLPAPATLKRAPSFGSVTTNNTSPHPFINDPFLASGVTTAPVTEKQPQDPETDNEEKARQTRAKRPRIKSNNSSRSGTPEKKKKGEDSPTPVETEALSSPNRTLRTRTVKPPSPSSERKPKKSPTVSTATNPTVSSAAKQSQKVKTKAATTPSRSSTRTTRPRVETIFGPELPVKKGIQTSPVANIDMSSLDPSKGTVLPLALSPTRTLRRVKTTLFNAGLGRRISFGSLAVPSQDTESSPIHEGTGLGSAFELS